MHRPGNNYSSLGRSLSRGGPPRNPTWNASDALGSAKYMGSTWGGNDGMIWLKGTPEEADHVRREVIRRLAQKGITVKDSTMVEGAIGNPKLDGEKQPDYQSIQLSVPKEQGREFSRAMQEIDQKFLAVPRRPSPGGDPSPGGEIPHRVEHSPKSQSLASGPG
ncbi:MAG: hypothetical protein HY053_03730 [Proteobacteria bacterium]|nr:hypothetical protein [Pseudomonadota bacterium]